MKYLTFTLLFGGLFFITSCGWSDNQKEAARKSIDEGFESGLESSGAQVDPKVKEAWLDCVIEKASEKYSFDEFTAATDKIEKLQEECAEEVGLFDAVSVK